MQYSIMKERMRVLVGAPIVRRLIFLVVGTSFVVILTLTILLRSDNGRFSIPSMPFFGPRQVIVTLQQGTYIGQEVKAESQALEHFLGIPYALSTGGDNRFSPPVPVKPSTETFDASNYGNACPAGSPGAVPQDEDCLSLNIYRPKKRPRDKKLPVLIYIYGGSFNFGASFNRDISNMVSWSSEPFIGVSFNYRIGAFGFLSSKFAKEEGLLNAGLKDQALLLQWIQENVAEFGGDPNDVTLMGQSAGAHSVGHHIMRNNKATPHFHKAILESGATTARACYTPTNELHEKQFREFLAILGCDKVPESQLLEKLRSYSTVEIKEASEKMYHKYDPSVRWPWQPVIDGEGGIIPVRPIDSWRAGKWYKIPILTGFNTNEGAAFTPKSLAKSKEFNDFFHTLLPGLSRNDLAILSKIYPDPLVVPSSPYVETRVGYNLGAEFKRAEQAYGHFAYVAPVRQTAHFAASAGDKPVYLYHFAVNSSIIGGADHGTHGGFPTYSRNRRLVSSTLEEVAGSMHAYWTSFITTGDPNAVKGMFAERPKWPSYKTIGGKLMEFGKNNDQIAGGSVQGTAVSISDDNFAVTESEYWWARTEKFER